MSERLPIWRSSRSSGMVLPLLLIVFLLLINGCAAPAPAQPSAPAEETAAPAEEAAAPDKEPAQVDMTVSEQQYTNTRDLRYCELFFFHDDEGTFDVYNTTDNECSDELWNNMDLDALAQEFGADRVTQNGPQYWMTDNLSLFGSELVDMGGIMFRFGVTIDSSAVGGGSTYVPFSPPKNQTNAYSAGSEVYEIVDADGNVYVLQARKDDIPLESLPDLGGQMQELPEGWEYRARVLDEDLAIVLTPDAPNPSVSDEFDQVYVMIPSDDMGAAPAGDGGETADIPEGWTSPQTMDSAMGPTFTLLPDSLSPARDFIYCELVFNYGDAGSDIYSTSPVAPCDLDWWDSLDLDALAAELNAESVVKNGPQWWSMDTVQEMTSEPTTVGGIQMVYGAVLPPGTMSTPKYEVFNTAKYQYLIYEAGKPTYQLIDPDGYAYIIQGYKVDQDQLATLGDQFQDLPEGWSYEVVTPDEDLILNLTPAAPIPSVQDEFDQIYIRIPGQDAGAGGGDGDETADIPEGWTSPQTMDSAMGPTFTLLPDSLSPARDFIYCELVFNYGDAGSDIYSTSPVAPCDLDWWDSLDLDALAAELNAESVVKNGPQWWAMDTVQEMTSEPTTVGGIQMVYGAVLPPGTMSTPKYEVFNTAKYQYLIYEAGKPTYQLIDPDGYAYIIQGYKVDQDQLATLGDQFQDLPEGWSYEVVTPDEDLILNLTPAAPIPSVQDEFDQIYIRIPGQ